MSDTDNVTAPMDFLGSTIEPPLQLDDPRDVVALLFVQDGRHWQIECRPNRMKPDSEPNIMAAFVRDNFETLLRIAVRDYHERVAPAIEGAANDSKIVKPVGRVVGTDGTPLVA